MKEIKRMFCVLALMLLCGCGSGWDRIKRRQAVVEKHGPEVNPVPGQNWQFIARDTNGAIWFVECGSAQTPNITSETMVFGPQKSTQ